MMALGDMDSDVVAPSSTAFVIINLINTALGGALGLMGNSFGASQLGIFWFVIGSLVAMILTHFSIQFLCRSAELSQSASTHNLANAYFGSRGSLLTKIFVCVGNWSFIVNITQLFADFMPILIVQWTDTHSAILTSRWCWCLVGLCLIFPWVLVSNIAKLEKLSLGCLVFAVLIFLILVSNGLKCIALDEIHDTAQWIVTDPYHIFLGLPSIAWCWALQFNCIPIYLTLHPETRLEQINSVSLWSCLIIFVFYALQGIAVYVVWAGTVDTDFLNNLSVDHEGYVFFFQPWVSTMTQFFICIACFGAIPIFAYESRTNLHAILLDVRDMWRKRTLARTNVFQELSEDVPNVQEMKVNEDSDSVEDDPLLYPPFNETYVQQQTLTVRVLEGLFLCVSAALVALTVRDLNLCLTLAGATYSCYMCFFLPSGVYIAAVSKMENHRKLSTYDIVLKWIAVFSIAYGTMISVAGIVTTFL